MSRPRITVAIPTYNRANRFLGEAIRSVLDQSYTDFELLIVDNASTDQTREFVAGIRDSRIRYHRHDENIGMHWNWKFCLLEPKTEFVALLMDDDLFQPEHLATGIRTLDEYKEASFYGCASRNTGAGEERIQRPYWLTNASAATYTAGRDMPHAMFRGNPVTTASIIFRRAAIDGVSVWGGKTWPALLDRLWTAQMMLKGGFVYHPAINILYRWHDQMYTTGWMKSGTVSVDERFVIRVIAEQALAMGILSPEKLVAEVTTWAPVDAAKTILALAARGTSAPLRRAAFEIYRKHPTIRTERASRHVDIAKRIGSWYLGVADNLERRRLKWPPKN